VGNSKLDGPMATKQQVKEALDNLSRLMEEYSAGLFDTLAWKNNVATLVFTIPRKTPYGTRAFNATARLSWSIAFEAVALREGVNGLEVYLRQRSDDDSAYPGEWHAPGSIFRPGETERDVANRLAEEFGAPITKLYFLGEVADWQDHKEDTEARGSFVSRVYLVEFDENQPPREDERHIWCPVGDLPEKTVWSHRDLIIPMAVHEYDTPPLWLPEKER